MTNQPGYLLYSPGELVLVTGASGTIGPSLIQKLVELDFRIRVYSRDALRYGQFNHKVEVIQGDIRDIDALRRAMAGVRYVFHLAAKLHIYNPTVEDTLEYQQVNVEGTRNVVLSALEENVTRLVFFSTINVYGPGESGVVFTEQSALKPRTIYSKTKVKAEKIIMEKMISKEGESQAVILRLAAVYGPQMKGNYLLLLRGLRDHWFVPIGKGNNRRTIINIMDVVNGAVLAAFHPQAGGKIYNLTDGNIYSLKRIIEVMCKALNRKAPSIHLPIAPARFIAGLMEDMLKIFNKRSPLNRRLVNTIVEDRAVSGDLIQAELNFSPGVTIEEGWSEIAESLGMINSQVG